ncbi:hypothetical protein [Spirosoma utsteinense]|uniref:Uncharacterized protein n=1 Tax=Spirosoma utsteinense TaxID=2585773 RepID=A0ABR6WG07_9BACT|nr:hypothetical protein [Spirosoma utsteinense]MBC3789348.1 hypothetical protein [Spirosoma utsteinense]MBC3795244.1 hypothetical protein [Spirosoma utsteinense]
MTFIRTPARQRVSLRQTHCDEWVAFYTAQLAIRDGLSRQHALEITNLRLFKEGQHAWAVVIKRQTMEIVSYELLNQTNQTTLQLHQDQEDTELEEAIRLH